MNRYFFIFLILIASKFLVLGSGCANIIPPEGGKRDSLPPVLTKVSPADSTRGFTGNRVLFTFDEFVELQSARENIILSPAGPETEVSSRLNTVTVKLKGTLDSNTTYSINFGNAIKDYNEGNVHKNFTYTFSTGAYIDSLELSGKVLLAETGKIDTTLIVMLHTSPEDSAVALENPKYVAKLDGNGGFIFRNLPPRTFYLYALKDGNGTKKYFANNLDKLFAFYGQPVVVTGKNAPINLYAYSPRIQAPAPAVSTTPGPRTGRITAGTDNRLKFQTNLSANQQDLLSGFEIKFDQPLRSFDSSKIRLYYDSTYQSASGYRFQKDSTNKKIELKTEWKEGTSYHLVLEKDFASDSAGRQLLKTDTLSFNTKKTSDYGSLQIRFRNFDAGKNPVLLFYSGSTMIRSFRLTSPDFNQVLFLPGEYELGILFDENKNGVWDPGIFFGMHKQPELVKPIERKIIVKAAWQNEFELETF